MNRSSAVVAHLTSFLLLGTCPLVAQNEPGSCSDVLYLAGRNTLNEYSRNFFDRASSSHSMALSEKDKQVLSSMAGGGSIPGVGGANFAQAKAHAESYRTLREAAASNREISTDELSRMQNTVAPEAIQAWNRCLELQKSNATMSVDVQDERHVIISVGDHPGGGRMLNGVLVHPEGAFACQIRQSGGAGGTTGWVVADRNTRESLQGRLFTIECVRKTNEAASIVLPSNPGVLISLPFPEILSEDERERNAAVATLMNLMRVQAELLLLLPVDQVFSYPNREGVAVDHLISPEDNRGIRLEVRGFEDGVQPTALTVTWNTTTRTLKPGGACAYTAPTGTRYRLVLREVDNRGKWALLQLFRVYAETPGTGVNCSDDGNVS